jgi:MFS superfamily sulfate permease-like transporter
MTTWVSILAWLGGMAGVMMVIALVSRQPSLARPFDHPVVYGFTMGITVVALLLASKGLPSYLALTGFLPVPYLLAASFVGSPLGLGVFLAGMIAEQLIGALG